MSKRKFRVLFLYPNLEMTSMVPQSIAILSAVLRACDIETDVFDTTFHKAGLSDHNENNVKTFVSKPYDFADKGIQPKTTDVYKDFKDVEKGYVSSDTLVDKNSFAESMLTMPELSNDTLMGLQRTFTMYVRFPKERWDEIRKAEELSPEGNMVFEKLSEELVSEYAVG